MAEEELKDHQGEEEVICLLAGNYLEAQRWARGQLLLDSEWFYPNSPEDLRGRGTYHVLVVGSAGYNVPTSYFNSLLLLAHKHGRGEKK